MSHKIIQLDGNTLNIETVYKIAYPGTQKIQLQIDPQARGRMQKARHFVLKIAEGNKPVYGINTGFGALSNKQVPPENIVQLQYNIVRSHCTGVGKPFPEGIVRAILLLRANCLVKGYSGVSPELVDLILEFLNHDITPIVPEKGSVGASGDLAPLAHIALALIGEGEVLYQGERKNSGEVLQRLNLKAGQLGPKDGLALINGTAVMTALGSLCLYEAHSLAKLSDINTCLTLEGLRGSDSAYNALIAKLKPQKGQLASTHNLNRLSADSEIKQSHKDCNRVQDPYSLRCAPQVHGACRQTFHHAQEVLEIEMNSVTDNPLIFSEEEIVLSGGNFHGEAVAMAMDYLAIGIAELGNICERRIEKMMNPVFSELPHFLTKESGLNSGLMIAHVTAAALASENKVLCHPASVDSIPTSTDKEDHVSMGVTSGRKLVEIIRNVKDCLAIELLCNTQAIEHLRPLKSSPHLEAVHSLIRKSVPPIEEDRPFYKDIQKIRKLIDSGLIVTTVENIIGELE